MSLKAAEISKLLAIPGKHADGDGLYLFARPSGKASWVAQYRFAGQTHWATIGPAALVSLADARKKHLELRLAVFNGVDPRGTIVAGTARAAGPTFREALDEYVKAKLPTWAVSNRDRELRHHAFVFSKSPDFTALPLAAIDQAAKNAAIATWEPKSRNYRDMGIYIDAVIKAAETGKVRHSSAAVEVKHHEAMGYAVVPTFYRLLTELDTVESRALRFLILTGARTDEVIGAKAKAPATWREIADVDGAPTWIIPAERMKGGKLHRVPLSAAAVALLGERRADDVSLFGGLGERSLRNALKSCDSNGYTVHGFRSSFRTWIAKATTFGDDLGELCIAHDKRSAVEKAYQRSDLLERRREVMEKWAAFCG
jgi:integrase